VTDRHRSSRHPPIAAGQRPAGIGQGDERDASSRVSSLGKVRQARLAT
jgi:hypothetical protein